MPTATGIVSQKPVFGLVGMICAMGAISELSISGFTSLCTVARTKFGLVDVVNP